MDERAKTAIDVHLVEFSILRAELIEMIKWRDRLVFVSLSIAGALLSFAFSQPPPPDGMSRRLALYLIAPLCSAIGGLWLVNTWRISRIGQYIRDTIRPRVNALLAPASPSEIPTCYEVLAWEISSERIARKWSRRLLEWLVLLTAFIFTGLLAQSLILQDAQGLSIRDRLLGVEMPILFSTNCIMMSACFLALVQHLVYGRKHVAQSSLSTF